MVRCGLGRDQPVSRQALHAAVVAAPRCGDKAWDAVQVTFTRVIPSLGAAPLA
jgi:hypothetical protein